MSISTPPHSSGRPRAVVSFPTASLGGRPKRMRENYAATMSDALARADLEAVEIKAAGELIYVVGRSSGAASPRE